MRAIVIAFLLAPAVAWGQAGQVFEWKGIKLGATEARFTSLQPCFVCNDRDEEGVRECVFVSDAWTTYDCRGAESYGGAPVSRVLAVFHRDRLALVRVLFDADRFGDVTQAQAARYGAAAMKGERLHGWKMGAATMATSRDGVVNIVTDAFAEEVKRLLNKREASRLRNNRSDL